VGGESLSSSIEKRDDTPRNSKKEEYSHIYMGRDMVFFLSFLGERRRIGSTRLSKRDHYGGVEKKTTLFENATFRKTGTSYLKEAIETKREGSFHSRGKD